MSIEIKYDDIVVGTEIPALSKLPITRQLVMWAGASRDFVEMHYDKDVAVARGLKDVIVHGALKASFLGQLITDWIGEAGILKGFKCRYQAIDYPGEEILCKGRVIKKYIKADRHLVDCEVWTENPRGEKTTTATATIEFTNS